jgi:TonB family protein
MIDSESSATFSFALCLAVLFHIFVIALLTLDVSLAAKQQAKQAFTAMRAVILNADELEPNKKLDNFQSVEQLSLNQSFAEKKQLATEKKAALRLEQAEKQKLFESAAEKLLLSAIAAQKQQREKVLAETGAQTREQTLEIQRLQAETAKMQAVAAQKEAELKKREQQAKSTEKSVSAEQLREQLISVIEEKINQFWQRPDKTDSLSCIVQMQLDSKGRIKKLFIEKSSGNKEFDNAAKNALAQVKFFPVGGVKQFPRETVAESFSLIFE